MAFLNINNSQTGLGLIKYAQETNECKVPKSAACTPADLCGPLVIVFKFH